MQTRKPLLLVCCLLAACHPAADTDGTTHADSIVPADASARRLFVYDCGPGSALVVRVSRDSAWVELPARTLHLPRVQSGSGARYSDGESTFWSRGDSALIQFRELQFPSCAGQPATSPWEAARLSGSDFRAVGNEPGWYADIHDDEMIVVVADYGERRAVTPAPAPEIDGNGRRTYRVQTDRHTLMIVIEEAPCADVMSGEPFPARVTLTLDGQEYTGCGRPLR